MPVSTLAVYAQRIGKVFASASTWGNSSVSAVGFGRASASIQPNQVVGVRATAPNEVWHIDTTILKLLDGTKAYLRAVIDNYSRKILAWAVTANWSQRRRARFCSQLASIWSGRPACLVR